MAAFDFAALQLSAPQTLPLEALTLGEGTQQTAASWPAAGPLRATIDEPSSLALALVGVVTLAAFRGIQKRVVGPSAPLSAAKPAAPASRAKIKPRRRAA